MNAKSHGTTATIAILTARLKNSSRLPESPYKANIMQTLAGDIEETTTPISFL